jgi:hypothetical protein
MIKDKDNFLLMHNIEALRIVIYNYIGSIIEEDLYKAMCVSYISSIYTAGFELKRFPKI